MIMKKVTNSYKSMLKAVNQKQTAKTIIYTNVIIDLTLVKLRLFYRTVR